MTDQEQDQAQFAAVVNRVESVVHDIVVPSYQSPADSTFAPADCDAYVVSWMKSGTTLSQNLLYQLMVGTGRVASDPDGCDFDDISQVVPFIDAVPVVGVSKPIHKYMPVVWKSHCAAKDFANLSKFGNGRFLYLIRDGRSVARSFLDFVINWVVDDVEEEKREHLYQYYFICFFLGLVKEEPENGKNENKDMKWIHRTDGRHSHWFQHVRSWLDSTLQNVLLIPYEDLAKNIPAWIPTIAAFVGLPPSDVTSSAIDHVVAMCDRNKMAADHRFNDSMISKAFGFRIDGGRRVRRADEKGYARFRLSDECEALYKKQFEEIIGFKDYAELKKEMYRRNDAVCKRLGIVTSYNF